MGRESTPSQPTLQQLSQELQRITESLQWYADSSKRCVCGHMAHTSRDLNLHREGCQVLKMAAIGDIIRVANLLGRTPTNAEYNAHRSDLLPSWSLLAIVVFDSWNDALTECRLPLVVGKKTPRNGKGFNKAIKTK